MLIRPFEFWHPRLFEAPYYLYLLAQCARHQLPVKYLAKANYALDHGELGLGSKYSTQMAFEQSRFLPSMLLLSNKPADQQRAAQFATQHQFPLILKPDIGAVGKGIEKIASLDQLKQAVEQLQSPSILQQFTAANFEYGVFYTRSKGVGQITGINQKHFPTVTGNGQDDIATLAQRHDRYTPHWNMFLKYLDTSLIPADGKTVQLSFVGSHTMGCKFTDDTHLVTHALRTAVDDICASQPGFNFGRFDVKAHSQGAFQAGDFVVIEVNGVASLPTQMFDPANSLGRAYHIFLNHGKLLADIANEHRNQPMPLLGYADIWRRATSNYKLLNDIHSLALEGQGRQSPE